MSLKMDCPIPDYGDGTCLKHLPNWGRLNDEIRKYNTRNWPFYSASDELTVSID
jgi:hypothetical protein